jgi:hypothetical protein
MKLTIFTALVFATAAVLSHTTASAADKITVYNGSYCKPYYGNESGNFSYGVSIHNSGGTRTIVCPLLLTDGFINKGASIWVYASAARSTDRVSCTFYSLNVDGIAVESQSSHRDGAGAGWLLPPQGGQPGQTPSFEITTDHSSYVMHCRLPQGSSVISIQVNEHL